MRNANVIPSLFLDFMQMQAFAKSPLIFVEGKGSRLTTADGRQFIDGLSGVFVTSLGQGNRPVIEAMTEQLNRLAFAPPLPRAIASTAW
jgi:adenosylmethionine-8-amino-7-oxononanoate aminotransferase